MSMPSTDAARRRGARCRSPRRCRGRAPAARDELSAPTGSGGSARRRPGRPGSTGRSARRSSRSAVARPRVARRHRRLPFCIARGARAQLRRDRPLHGCVQRCPCLSRGRAPGVDYPAGVSVNGPAIVVDGVSKHFRLPHEQRPHAQGARAAPVPRRTLRRRCTRCATSPSTSSRASSSGSSAATARASRTLLKCLAGHLPHRRGRIYVDGRLSTFIELGVGFNPDLAARDNVMLNAIMLGLTPKRGARALRRRHRLRRARGLRRPQAQELLVGHAVRLAFSV